MQTYKRLTLPVISALLVSAVAHGSTITQIRNFSFVPNDNVDLTFDQFDPNAGAFGVRTLTSITIGWQLIKNGGSLFVDNESATPASGAITQTVEIDLTSSDVTFTNESLVGFGSNITAVTSYTASVGADDGDSSDPQQYDSGGPDNDGTFFGQSSTTTGSDNVASALFAQYTGTGTFVINADGIQFSDTAALGGVSFSGTPSTAFGNVTVTYNYSAIPEPSAALLGGLGALLLLRRRR